MSKPICEHYENPCYSQSFHSEPRRCKKVSCCEPRRCKKSSCYKFDCCRPNCCGGVFISPLTSLLVGPGPVPNGD